MTNRRLELTDGTTTMVELPDEAWAYIDRAALRHEVGWKEWARMVLEFNPDAWSVSAFLQHQALHEACDTLAEGENRHVPHAMDDEHEMLRDRVWVLGEGDLEAEAAVLKVSSREDFTAFEFIAGYHEGNPVVLIRNKMEAGLSVILSRNPIHWTI